MAEARGQRKLKLRNVAVWANKEGTFLASTDPDCSFIVALHQTPEQHVRTALRRFHRKMD
jgi:hypothetical protein